MQVFSVFDVKAGAYLRPFFEANVETALRAVARAALDPSHNFCMFGGDYSLFHLGEWDEKAGVIMQFDAHVNLGTMVQIGAALKRDRTMFTEVPDVDA